MFHNPRDSRIVVKVDKSDTARRVYVFRECARLNVVPRFFEVHLPGRFSHSRRRHAQFPPAIEVDVMPRLSHEGRAISDFSTRRIGSSIHLLGIVISIATAVTADAAAATRRLTPWRPVFRSLANHPRVAPRRFMRHRGRGFQPSPIQQSSKQNISNRSDKRTPSVFT